MTAHPDSKTKAGHLLPCECTRISVSAIFDTYTKTCPYCHTKYRIDVKRSDWQTGAWNVVITKIAPVEKESAA